MNRTVNTLLQATVTLAVLAIADPGAAQMRAGAFTLSPMVGGYFFDSDQGLDDSLLLALGLGYEVDDRWSGELMFNYVPSESGRGDVDVVSYRLDGLYHFDAIREVVPYLAAGVGGITFDPDWKGRDTDPLVNYGGGLEYFIRDNIALRADVRHAISLFATEHNVALAVGASFFLRPPAAAPAAPMVPVDSDRDGVADAIDQCPDTALDVAVGANGCPEDGDRDGVYDYLDRCPDTPPRVAVDAHGCPPQRDSDGDGVVDGRDRCPGTPAGTPVDATGCSRDADRDGVPDAADRCPGTPAGAPVDAAGCPKDSDGDGVADYLDRCPDTLAGARVDERGCWVLRGVQFELGKATLRPESFSILDEVVPVLRRNPGLRVEVQGHSDSTGSTAFNERLSEMRARAVMAYFVSKGVAPARLTAKGFGAIRPAASNDTAEGRAKNRRVELKPLR